MRIPRPLDAATGVHRDPAEVPHACVVHLAVTGAGRPVTLKVLARVVRVELHPLPLVAGAAAEGRHHDHREHPVPPFHCAALYRV